MLFLVGRCLRGLSDVCVWFFRIRSFICDMLLAGLGWLLVLTLRACWCAILRTR
jgi:hypothetical protein